MKKYPKIWKLAAVCILGLFTGLLGDGGRVEADIPGVCSMPGRPSCTANSQCQDWCGPLAEGYFCERSCCWCIM
jgi:hypothetical protein